MTEFSALWRSLEEESRGSTADGGRLLRRRIHPEASVQMYLAVRPPTNVRFLLIEAPAAWEVSPGQLPRWSGLEIEVWPPSGPVLTRLIVLRQQIAAHHGVFDSVIADVCRALAEVAHADDGFRVLLSALGKWQSFFQRHGFEGLSPQQQQGLFGELAVLRDCLLTRIGSSATMDAWTGGDRTTHDFQFAGGALEVKTTRTKEPLSVRISNERQLDDAGLELLVLAAVSLEARQHGGESLASIIDDLRHKLADDNRAGLHFEDRLKSYGYLDGQASEYEVVYFIEGMDFYSVSAGFPRLLSADLPNGVGDVRYSITLSACDAFKTDPSDFVTRLS